MDSIQERANRSSLMFETKKPHFFKLVLENTLRDGKLSIPKKFITKYGNNLSNPVLLKVPSGEIWQVELAKSDGEMWHFQAGWKEFVEFYSLAHGHFLVFQYNGASNFQVLIFDTSATEIEYPIYIINGEKGPNSRGRFQDARNEETEILDDFPPSRKTKEKIATPRPDKRMRMDSIASKFESPSKLQTHSLVHLNGNQSGGVKLENATTDANVDSPTQKSKGPNIAANAGERSKSTRKNWTNTMTWDKKINAYGRARATFKSNNPFFMIVMHPSHLDPAEGRLRIPSKFARKYFKESANAVLNGLDGRRWSVTHSCTRFCTRFSKGWKKFVLDNNLEVGDVCIFELTIGTQFSFNVVICRVVQDGNYCTYIREG